jgi:hypothetical protein
MLIQVFSYFLLSIYYLPECGWAVKLFGGLFDACEKLSTSKNPSKPEA